jgi:hypothetical protein
METTLNDENKDSPTSTDSCYRKSNHPENTRANSTNSCKNFAEPKPFKRSNENILDPGPTANSRKSPSRGDTFKVPPTSTDSCFKKSNHLDNTHANSTNNCKNFAEPKLFNWSNDNILDPGPTSNARKSPSSDDTCKIPPTSPKQYKHKKCKSRLPKMKIFISKQPIPTHADDECDSQDKEPPARHKKNSRPKPTPKSGQSFCITPPPTPPQSNIQKSQNQKSTFFIFSEPTSSSSYDTFATPPASPSLSPQEKLILNQLINLIPYNPKI